MWVCSGLLTRQSGRFVFHKDAQISKSQQGQKLRAAGREEIDLDYIPCLESLIQDFFPFSFFSSLGRRRTASISFHSTVFCFMDGFAKGRSECCLQVLPTEPDFLELES